MNTGAKHEAPPKDGGPAKQQDIGLHMLKDAWFKVVGYVIIIILVRTLHPRLWLLILLLNAWSCAVSIYYKRFTIKRKLVGLAYLNGFILFIYALYKIVGGVWAVIIAHVVGVAYIIWGNRKFIKQAQTQINTMAKDLRKRKGWDK